MSNLYKELLRKYISEQKFTNSNEVLLSIKELFRDVLQDALEAELDGTLGYEKHEVNSKTNSRNGYSKKAIKSELGTVSLNIPRDLNGEFEPQIIPKHQRNINGIEDKILSYLRGTPR